jgi:hypothetical protein
MEVMKIASLKIKINVKDNMKMIEATRKKVVGDIILNALADVCYKIYGRKKEGGGFLIIIDFQSKDEGVPVISQSAGRLVGRSIGQSLDPSDGGSACRFMRLCTCHSLYLQKELRQYVRLENHPVLTSDIVREEETSSIKFRV